MSSEKIENMIGQMIMVGFRGTEVSRNSEIIRDFYDLNIGGTILFDYDVVSASSNRNIKNREQVKKLTHDLQSYARTARTPLFVAIDQEGGNTVRLKPEHGYEKTRNAADIGKRNDPLMARLAARKIANQVSSSGFNVNLAPVVDLSINKDNPVIVKPGRALSDDPEKVIRYAEIFIKEHMNVNVLTCIKHFMGHGNSKHDTHKGFVDVSETYNEIEKVPFRKLIKNGIVDMVMTAHLYNRNYDDSYPFTLSRRVITDILRNEMGFDGVVISDDMQMKAISENYSFEDSVIRAVNAGVDIILIGNNIQYDPDAHLKAINVISDSVKNGTITFERIKASFDRITKLKRKMKKLRN
ncbi:MAG: glycoside hydrolase family 3 protein [Candidatus Anammoxibacter sp.]